MSKLYVMIGPLVDSFDVLGMQWSLCRFNHPDPFKTITTTTDCNQAALTTTAMTKQQQHKGNNNATVDWTTTSWTLPWAIYKLNC